jgi:hypothetical protein
MATGETAATRAEVEGYATILYRVGQFESTRGDTGGPAISSDVCPKVGLGE